MRSEDAATRAISRVWPEVVVVADFAKRPDYAVRGYPPKVPGAPWQLHLVWMVPAVLLIAVAVSASILAPGGWDRSERKPKVRGTGPGALAVGLGEASRTVRLGGINREPWLAAGGNRVTVFVTANGEVRTLWEGRYESMRVYGSRRRPLLRLTFADSSSIELPLSRAQGARAR
ncbi:MULTISPECIES: hypothetical protein [unclassified Crossiella]|uniref:hypothetical protein n=1 Tax=unclassified Crossiella TaxID=2620835 RepID=UPI001FFF8109|nr:MULTISPECIES: hypothetical protein [unclassified Crossiella]MCK2242009.1 hypothetical protein [Crossiella sp. S99.2]MCK2255912.1 hypothetical protein [Crossiella sp. S99.1]